MLHVLSCISNVIAVALCCFYFSSSSSSSSSTDTGGVTTVTAKPLILNNDFTTKVHFGGRWWYNEDDGSMEHSWGVGTFIVKLKGSTKLIMRMKSAYAGAYYTCRVRVVTDNGENEHEQDGVEYQVHHENTNEYVEVASGLVPNHEYIIHCGRNNEALWGSTVIYGVELDDEGELLQAVDPNAENTMLRFEAIGDSITAGFKVTSNSASEPSTIANQDVFQTYIRYMADAWKTEDYNVIAKSGVSILDYGTTGVVMSQEWPCRQFWDTWQGSCPALWDFSNWQADVVTINLGTNDFAFGDPTQQQFREGYFQFLQEVRSKYPNALIACIEPIQHSCYGENDARLTGIVDGLEEAVIDMNDPRVIYYETGNSANQWLDCDTNTRDFVDFTHPTVSGNEKFAARLLETMTEDVRRFFPNKCGGSGISCDTGPASPTIIAPAAPTTAPNPITPPTLSPLSVPTVSSPDSDPQTNGNSCVAMTQNELPSGSWATNNVQCAKCSAGYAYWPCDQNNPSLCRCTTNDDNNNSNIEPSSPPVALAPPVSTPTISPISVPGPDPQTYGKSCVAIIQNELPSGSWATSDLQCAKCSTSYAYWPCDQDNPSLCRCTANDDHNNNSEPSSPLVAPPVSSNPTNSPSAIVSTDVPIGTKKSSRLIAYLGNWQSCPTDKQMAQYTHIVIAFAVSYTWNSEKNICSETCEIASPSVCENSAHPELIEKWKAAGKKIILSFGGAGMGGSWAGDNNNCWDYCFGREDQVVNQLTSIVNEMGLDGVDIDYEYFYEDNQNGSGFTKGAQAQRFLKDITIGLRSSMPSGSELTHAPMEPDMEPGRAYFDVLKEVASSLDFLMPQYYNGYIRSFTNFPGALSHFTTIANEMFDSDASKIVYGFCIGDCGTFNSDGYQSADVMKKLSKTYPNNGGVFFWVANDDTNGDWSRIMKDQLDDNDNRSSSPNETSRCGCESCTQQVLDSLADGYSCGSRIDWVILNIGLTESDACKMVGDEYLTICGACDCYNDNSPIPSPIENRPSSPPTQGNTAPFSSQNDIEWDGSDLVLTHYWDCSGQSCDATTLSPWNYDKYRSPSGYSPQDPNDFGGPSSYGEKLWVTAAIMNIDQGSDDGCCGSTSEGGCGNCVLIQNPDSLHPDWSVMAMKKNTCGNCGSSKHADINVPGFDVLQYSLANICGDEPNTGLTKDQSTILGEWYKTHSNTVDAGAELCGFLPEAYQKGCSIFSNWGWIGGKTSRARYKVVDCPQQFKTFVGSLFDENGVIN